MRILIVRLSSLGDVVHAAPVLSDLRAAFPGAQVDWVAEEAFVPLVRCFSGVRRTVPFALRRWKKSLWATRPEWTAFAHELRGVPYDAVLDLQGLIKSAVVTRVARLAPGGRRIGLANQTDGSAYEPLARWAYSEFHPMPVRIHVVERSRRLAAMALGYAVQGPPVVPWQPPPLDPQDAAWARPDQVLLVHGSAKPVKELPVAFWGQLGRELVARGLKPLVTWGTEGERQRAEAICRDIGDAAAVPPRLPLDRLAASMQHLRGSIGLDTGLSHMAATLGLPTVQVFIEDKAWRAAADWQPRTAVVQAASDALPDVPQVLGAWESVA